MMDGLISNEAFINNADSNSRSSSSSSNDPLGVLLEAPLGAYRRLIKVGFSILWKPCAGYNFATNGAT